jgi:hypothetical protein
MIDDCQQPNSETGFTSSNYALVSGQPCFHYLYLASFSTPSQTQLERSFHKCAEHDMIGLRRTVDTEVCGFEEPVSLPEKQDVEPLVSHRYGKTWSRGNFHIE